MEIVIPNEYKHLFIEDEEHPILKYPNPILNQKSQPVERITEKTRELVSRMAEVCKKWGGTGFAAVQLGVLERVFIVMPEDVPTVFINPEILETHGEVIFAEDCMSLPGLFGDVKRASEVRVRALDLEGRPFERTLMGYDAIVFQHEMSHLDGVLFIELADPTTFNWQPVEY